MPKVPPEDPFDRYGFKPSGSTVAALIDITETVSNNYSIREKQICHMLPNRLF